MLYRATRMIRDTYAMAVLASYIVAGAAAFLLMFIFPPASLFILFFSLLSLGFVAIAAKLLSWLERHLASRAIARGQCPSCDRHDTLVHDDVTGFLCADCGSAFAPSGERANETPQTAR